MYKKILLLMCVLCIMLVTTATEGYSYHLLDTGIVPASSPYGVKENKNGGLMVKKRVVSTSSMREELDQEAEIELSLEQYPKIKVVATGYTAGFESTGKTPDHPSYGVTFSGAKVRRDKYSTIAADLRVFPLGTILYIPGYGFGVVADKGGAIRGKKIDLYFQSREDVFSLWGKKTVDVYMVQKGFGEVTDSMMNMLNERGIAALSENIN